jgi:hypothetical protein
MPYRGGARSKPSRIPVPGRRWPGGRGPGCPRIWGACTRRSSGARPRAADSQHYPRESPGNQRCARRHALTRARRGNTPACRDLHLICTACAHPLRRPRSSCCRGGMASGSQWVTAGCLPAAPAEGWHRTVPAAQSWRTRPGEPPCDWVPRPGLSCGYRPAGGASSDASRGCEGRGDGWSRRRPRLGGASPLPRRTVGKGCCAPRSGFLTSKPGSGAGRP